MSLKNKYHLCPDNNIVIIFEFIYLFRCYLDILSYLSQESSFYHDHDSLSSHASQIVWALKHLNVIRR